MTQTATHHQCAQSSAPVTVRFCPDVAMAIGVSEAIVLHRLDYWLGRSKHSFGGRFWVYNTYDAWQAQFPFWSRRTIQATFRRLERLGLIESSQRHNRSRWDKTKWYTIDYAKWAELVPQVPPLEVPAIDAPESLSSIAPNSTTDETPNGPIDDADSAPSWNTNRSPMTYTSEILTRAGEGEPDEEARPLTLQTPEPTVTADAPQAKPRITEAQAEAVTHPLKPVNELDAAYEAIPEPERETWYQRAERALEAAGMPEWMRIAAVIKEAAIRLWAGIEPVPVASG